MSTLKKLLQVFFILFIGTYTTKFLLRHGRGSYELAENLRRPYPEGRSTEIEHDGISRHHQDSNTEKEHVDNLRKGNQFTKTQRNLHAANAEKEHAGPGNQKFEKRKDLRTTLCNISKVKLHSKFTRNMLIDDTHKLLYCYVPKVGCTKWKKIFAVLSNETIRNQTEGNPENITKDPHYNLHFKSMLDYNSSYQKLILKSYYKFMFVREPFERLVSAYIDKFYVPEPDGFWKAWGKGIIKKYRHNASEASRKCGHDVTFDEFLAHALSKVEQSDISSGNTHWTTTEQICNPCGIQYDYIGHIETMTRDTELILDQANVSHLIVEHKASIRNVKQNLHFNDKALINAGDCLDLKDAMQRVINSIIFKGFLETNSTMSEYIRSPAVRSTNITNVRARNEYTLKQFSSKLDEILTKAWEDKLKSPESTEKSHGEDCIYRLKKSKIVKYISSKNMKRFLEYFYLDFELFGYNSTYYSKYIEK